MQRSIVCLAILLTVTAASVAEAQTSSLLPSLTSPVIFQGDAVDAYRDPAVIYNDGVFHLYFTLANLDTDGGLISVTAHSQSVDLKNWSEPVAFTPYDRNLNYSSPGNIIRQNDEWVLCLQTYPTPLEGQYTGSQDSRIWTMRSNDLINWGTPELLRVKGPNVAQADMGRMIDPYLIKDKDDPSKWWCLYKQNGASRSWSYDLETWNYEGNVSAGENVCVINDEDEDDYVMFASPSNGVSVSRSPDLQAWEYERLLTLGQEDWPWANGRLTAGVVIDLRDEPLVEKYLMFFHGSQASATIPETHGLASIGIAWSDDLVNWDWPGKVVTPEPSSMTLITCGFLTFVSYTWRKSKMKNSKAIDTPYVQSR